MRTFPIIGICGSLMARLSDGQPYLLAAGALIVGAWMCLSYKKKLEGAAGAGLTSEGIGVSSLFSLARSCFIRHYEEEATALTVSRSAPLLRLKSALEALAKRIPARGDCSPFTRFLLISAVILPIVRNREFTELHLNPLPHLADRGGDQRDVLWRVCCREITLIHVVACCSPRLLGGFYSSIVGDCQCLSKRVKRRKIRPNVLRRDFNCIRSYVFPPDGPCSRFSIGNWQNSYDSVSRFGHCGRDPRIFTDELGGKGRGQPPLPTK